MAHVAHTPGPWRVIGPYSGGHYSVQRGKEGGFIVTGTSTEREEADARLIAAAPDLMEALHVVRISVGWLAMTMETRALIEAAMAKATTP